MKSKPESKAKKSKSKQASAASKTQSEDNIPLPQLIISLIILLVMVSGVGALLWGAGVGIYNWFFVSDEATSERIVEEVPFQTAMLEQFPDMDFEEQFYTDSERFDCFVDCEMLFKNEVSVKVWDTNSSVSTVETVTLPNVAVKRDSDGAIQLSVFREDGVNVPLEKFLAEG